MSPNQIPTIIIVIWNKLKFSFPSFLSSFFFSFSFPPFLFYSINTSSCELAKLYSNSILHVCNTMCWAIITSRLILTQCREEGTVISPVVQMKLRHRVLTQFANTTHLASGWTKSRIGALGSTAWVYPLWAGMPVILPEAIIRIQWLKDILEFLTKAF